MVLKTNGSVLVWGSNDEGQTNVPVAAQSGVMAIGAGQEHTVALKDNGRVLAWGAGGDENDGQTNVPFLAQSGVIAIAAGGFHTVALKDDGSVLAWGYNAYGQTTVPVEAQSGVIAIAAGYLHSVALKSDGSVVAWGANCCGFDHGQTTVPVTAHTEVIAIAAGAFHTVALKIDGSVVAWGDNTYGQTNVPFSAQSGVIAIAAGDHTVALKNDGTVIAWGRNEDGQSTVPAGLNGVTAIAAGNDHTVVIGILTVSAFSFIWSNIPSPQITNAPFAGTIQARDSSNQVVTSFTGPVLLRDAATEAVASNTLLPQVAQSFEGGIGHFTYGYSFTPGTNITVRAVRHYSGTKVSIWTDGGLLLVARAVTSIPGAWVETPLAAPLTLTAGKRYRLGSYIQGQNFYAGDRMSTNFPDGVFHQGYVSNGDGFPTNLDPSRWAFVDLRYTAPAVAASMAPANSGNFTNGVWSGTIRISSPATNLVLLADDGAGHRGSSEPFHVVRSNQPPIIVTPPSNQIVSAGRNASFSPNVYGTPALTYQWRRNGTNIANGGRISGATNSILTISNVIESDAAFYSVLVDNSVGWALSSSAALTTNLVDHFSWSFIPSPVSTLMPFAVTVQARDSSSNIVPNFNGTVAIRALLTENGTLVSVSPDASGPFVGGVWKGSLSIPQIATNVVLRADNGLGDVGFSRPFDVAQIAGFAIQATNQNVLPGTNVTLVASAIGTGPMRYQWRFEGTNIPDATNASYSFTGANLANHHGNFSVVASDDLSTAIGSNAFIYVLVKPGIVQHIVSQSALQGRSLTFSLVATGAPPLWYRWIKGGANYATTSVPVLVINNIEASTILRVAVTNRASPSGTFSPGPNSFQNVNLTMIPDADGDGLPDAWELAYFGNTTNVIAAADPDGDGMVNCDEYLAGTNPTNGLSYLKIDSVVTEGSGHDLLRLEFNAVSNKTYTLQYRDAVAIASWSNLTDFASAPTNRIIFFTNTMLRVTKTRYYRLVTPRQSGE